MGFYGYGMGQAQSLGQGTFTFDRIAPNRYLLDTQANIDKVLPGRYSLVEYTCPITVVEGSEISPIVTPITIIGETVETQYITEYLYDFIYNPSSKIYDIFPVNNEGKISMDGTKKIFISTFDRDDKYRFYYANFPGSSDSDTEPNETIAGVIHKWHLYKLNNEESISIFSFNREVDRIYAATPSDNIVMQNESEGWDSTAWLKIVQHEFDEDNKPTKSAFKYINVANLNVLTPNFNVVTDDQIIPPITTFTDNIQGIFNAPQIKQGQNATFNIRYPNPMDINISIDTSTIKNSATAEFKYSDDKNGKDYTLYLPEIGRLQDSIRQATDAATSATEAATSATQAANEATSITENIRDRILGIFTDQQVIIDWQATTSTTSGTQAIVAIDNKPEIIKAVDINSLWN